MIEEFKAAVRDYFTPEELVGLLELDNTEFIGLVDYLEDLIIDNADEIKEYMNYGES